ncbi:MAG: C13 family peptidase [Burkholderiaceae bacterium]|nr:C13 family peptidase [Burkholderiaceae bacterium]
MTDSAAWPDEGSPSLPPVTGSSGLVQWLREGARTAFFLRPRVETLRAGPATLLCLLVLLVLNSIGLQRSALDGPANFDATAIFSGWLATLLTVGACWIVSRSRRGDPPAATGTLPTSTLFALLLAQELVLSVPLGLVYLAALHWAAQVLPDDTRDGLEGLWIASLAWGALASAVALWRLSSRQWTARAAIVVNTALSVGVPWWAPGPPYWVEDRPSLARPALVLSQALIESQAAALPAALAGLRPGRPGVVELYAIAFAPYGDEDVFSREASLVSGLMRSRFDARDRVVQLQNHVRSAGDVPWATPANLQRAIAGVARVMNLDEDILFIHLTSHGARDGRLAASFGPLAVDEVTPQQLARWLDDAGVRYRVISISACYSGSWIAPLSGPGTLVMTAADARHTSYGCGRKSELTFFGRAMYDEQLRHTHSFEAAHAAVRPVIAQREKAAGKTDGYSNPQIAVGRAIRGPLLTLQQRLDALPMPH